MGDVPEGVVQYYFHFHTQSCVDRNIRLCRVWRLTIFIAIQNLIRCGGGTRTREVIYPNFTPDLVLIKLLD